MLRILSYSPEQDLQKDVPVERLPELLKDYKNLLWVDFQGTLPEEDYPILLDTLAFHPLAVDDALQESHVPKLDDWGEYLYIVLHAVKFDEADGSVDTLELDVFIGQNYVVTHHDDPIEAVDRVWTACDRDERFLKFGADQLLYRLADEVVASFMPVVDDMDDVIDRLEDEIFDHPSPRTLEQIFSIKRGVLRLRRIIGPQREVLNKLARDDYQVIDARARVYFRDVYDHLVRLYDIAESIRDLVGGTLDTYLSVINNRMNEIMKTLTLITTLFMPLSFVVGFFGMNFFIPNLPVSNWVERPAFLLTLGILALTPIVMYSWMRRRGWM